MKNLASYWDFFFAIEFPSLAVKRNWAMKRICYQCYAILSGISRLPYQILWTLDLPNHRYVGIFSINFHEYPLKRDLSAFLMECSSVVCRTLCCLNCISLWQLLGSLHTAAKNYCLFWHSAKMGAVYLEMPVRKVQPSFKCLLGSSGSLRQYGFLELKWVF